MENEKISSQQVLLALSVLGAYAERLSLIDPQWVSIDALSERLGVPESLLAQELDLLVEEGRVATESERYALTEYGEADTSIYDTPFPETLLFMKSHQDFWDGSRPTEPRDLMDASGLSRTAINHRVSTLSGLGLVEPATGRGWWLTWLGSQVAGQLLPPHSSIQDATSGLAQRFNLLLSLVRAARERPLAESKHLWDAVDAEAAAFARLLED